MTLPLVAAIGVVLRLIGGVVMAIVEGLNEEHSAPRAPLASGATARPVLPAG